MLITPAYAQAPGGGGEGFLLQLLPLILIFVVFYFLLIRPQQNKMKQHRAMIGALKRGDRVLTAGGIIGNVVKVEESDDTLLVEIAKDIRVKVARHTISDLLSKPQPASAASTPSAGSGGQGEAKGGMLGQLFGRK